MQDGWPGYHVVHIEPRFPPHVHKPAKCSRVPAHARRAYPLNCVCHCVIAAAGRLWAVGGGPDK
eukprot:3196317-Prymnesium_polylepis.1